MIEVGPNLGGAITAVGVSFAIAIMIWSFCNVK